MYPLWFQLLYVCEGVFQDLALVVGQACAQDTWQFFHGTCICLPACVSVFLCLCAYLLILLITLHICTQCTYVILPWFGMVCSFPLLWQLSTKYQDMYLEVSLAICFKVERCVLVTASLVFIQGSGAAHWSRGLRLSQGHKYTERNTHTHTIAQTTCFYFMQTPPPKKTLFPK